MNSSVFKKHIPHSSFHSNGLLKESSFEAKDQSIKLKKDMIPGNDLRRPHHSPPPSPDTNKQEQYNISVESKPKIRKKDPIVSICLKNTRYKKINVPLSSPNSNSSPNIPAAPAPLPKPIDNFNKNEIISHHIKTPKKTNQMSKYTKINTKIPLKTDPGISLTLPPKISPNQNVSSPNSNSPFPNNIAPIQIPSALAKKPPPKSETKTRKNSSSLSQFKFVMPSKKEPPVFTQEDTQEAIQITGIKRTTSPETNDSIKVSFFNITFSNIKQIISNMFVSGIAKEGEGACPLRVALFSGRHFFKHFFITFLLIRRDKNQLFFSVNNYKKSLVLIMLEEI